MNKVKYDGQTYVIICEQLFLPEVLLGLCDADRDVLALAKFLVDC